MQSTVQCKAKLKDMLELSTKQLKPTYQETQMNQILMRISTRTTQIFTMLHFKWAARTISIKLVKIDLLAVLRRNVYKGSHHCKFSVE